MNQRPYKNWIRTENGAFYLLIKIKRHKMHWFRENMDGIKSIQHFQSFYVCFICSLISILDWGACKPCTFLCFCVLLLLLFFCYTSFVKVKITFWHFIVWLWIWSFIAIIIELNCICIAQVHHKSCLKVICKENADNQKILMSDIRLWWEGRTPF